MTQTTFLAFVATFVVGPLLCAAAMALPGRLAPLIGLAIGVVAAVTLALRWQLQGGPAQLWSLVALWLAWVLAVAMVARALQSRLDTPRARRILTILALLATTLPWFGLATARMMS